MSEPRLTEDQVESWAKTDAQEATEVARASQEPVAFITGDSRFPPLRSFGYAENVWHSEEPTGHVYSDMARDLWVTYAEKFESTLNRENVFLGTSDEDGSLYVVDLKRWSLRSDCADAATLNDEWERVT